jgi:hypothetical protein
MRWSIWWVDLDILLVPLPGHPPEVIQAPSRYPQDTHIIYSLHIAPVAPGYRPYTPYWDHAAPVAGPPYPPQYVLAHPLYLQALYSTPKTSSPLRVISRYRT